MDEFAFRFNRRSSRQRGLLFHRLLEQAMQIEHVPVSAIAVGAFRAYAFPRRRTA